MYGYLHVYTYACVYIYMYTCIYVYIICTVLWRLDDLTESLGAHVPAAERAPLPSVLLLTCSASEQQPHGQ